MKKLTERQRLVLEFIIDQLVPKVTAEASEQRATACWDLMGDEAACGGKFPGKRKHTDADQAPLFFSFVLNAPLSLRIKGIIEFNWCSLTRISITSTSTGSLLDFN